MKTATLRGTAVTARVGLWLGVAVAVCFVTGLISHFIQHPQPWFFWPTRPVWLYRVTQGLHVISGHRGDPADRRQAVVGVAEAVRAAVDRRAGPPDRTGVDPGAGRVDAVSAVHRPAQHRAVVRVQVLLHDEPLRDVVCRGRRGAGAHRGEAADHPPRAGRAARRHSDRSSSVGPTRRTVLRGTWLAVAIATVVTAGQTIPLLRRVSVLAPRSGARAARSSGEPVGVGGGSAAQRPVPGLPVDGDQRVDDAGVHRRRTGGACRRPPTDCRSRAWRGGVPRPSGRVWCWPISSRRSAARPTPMCG